MLSFFNVWKQTGYSFRILQICPNFLNFLKYLRPKFLFFLPEHRAALGGGGMEGLPMPPFTHRLTNQRVPVWYHLMKSIFGRPTLKLF